MKFIIVFALLAIAAADVSHLNNNYLPPINRANSDIIVSHSGPIIGHAAPAVTYGAPIVHHSFSAPLITYSSPSYSAGHAARYSLPSVRESYAAPNFHSSFSAPTFESYNAPSVSHYSTSGVEGSFSVPAFKEFISESDVGTEYADNGGYVYRKK